MGLYLYDRRIWHKDPAWANCKWTTNTLKSVSETEDLYIFWKPGEYVVNRDRLTPEEWKEWGYRQVWDIPSVRANDVHSAMFPVELASRVIRLFSDVGDVVLDPFVGSGTTAIAAIQTGRKYIGIEMMPQYAKLAQDNVRKASVVQDEFPQLKIKKSCAPAKSKKKKPSTFSCSGVRPHRTSRACCD